AICLRALSKQRDQRYQSAAGLADEGQRFLADEPVAAYSDRSGTRAARWARRHRMLVSNAAALLVMASIALAVGMIRLGQERQAALDAESKARQSDAAREKALGF